MFPRLIAVQLEHFYDVRKRFRKSLDTIYSSCYAFPASKSTTFSMLNRRPCPGRLTSVSNPIR